MLYALLKPLIRLFFRLFCRLETRGREHVPPSGAALLVSNHLSVLDPPLIGVAAPRPLTFLAKAELFEIPLFGRLIRAVNARPVRREGGDAAALRAALRILENGGALLMFPEGTRREEGALGPPRGGAGMLAALSGVPVVPVYVSGSGHAWPRGRRFPRPGKVTVTFGAPLSFARGAGAGKKERYEMIGREMMAAIAGLRDLGAGTGSPDQVPWQAIDAVGGAGVTAQSPTQYTQGRNGRHEG
jgi:1-acyl-sn-glycerol-3-phosphate acyltransferase